MAARAADPFARDDAGFAHDDPVASVPPCGRVTDIAGGSHLDSVAAIAGRCVAGHDAARARVDAIF